MLSSFHFAVSALLKALCSLALSVSHTVVPLCSPCYRKNFILSVREALYDPVLHHGSRFDFDMNFCMLVLLCVCVCVHMCVCVYQRFIMARLHNLRPVHQLPGFMAYSSIPIG